MTKTQIQDTLFQMTTIQKMSDNSLTKFIKDLNDDLEYINNQYGYKTQICTKEELERDTRFFTYCRLLLEIAQKERENRKSK